MHERGPEAMKPLVEEFFNMCRDVVVNQDGIVDHFLGDAVMALFNVPIRHEDHIARAVKCATEIQLAVPEINAKLQEVDVLKVGIGVSASLAYCGTVGSNDCKDYTALGARSEHRLPPSGPGRSRRNPCGREGLFGGGNHLPECSRAAARA